MKAMIFDGPGRALEEREVAKPDPGEGQILIRIRACAVCRTDLHIMDGELAHPKLPLILGHEIVGEVAETGMGATRFNLGDRVGVPWLGWTCGTCRYCESGRENLCERALFTGYTLDGGFAEFTVADERFCFPIPPHYSDVAAAPLLCAGLIGHRCLLKTGTAKNLGIYGFGGAADIVAQIAMHEGRSVFAFTRPGDGAAQEFARKLGVAWAGGSHENPPVELDAAIIFAPDGSLLPTALAATARGACVVCGGIHMSEIPAFAYDILWQERSVSSVANLTRRDGAAFMALAPTVPVKTETKTFRLGDGRCPGPTARRGIPGFRGVGHGLAAKEQFMLSEINKFYGKKLAAKDGPIGHIRDFYFDDRSWAVLYVVADTGSWLPGRQVLLSPHAFANFDENERSLAVRLHIKQIEDSPSIDEHKPVSRQFEEEYYSYYAWPTYWQGPQMWGMGSSPIVVPPPGMATEHVHHTSAEPHLRSTKAMNGYKVQGTDGVIGHMIGFMMDNKGWAIRDLVIATDPWYLAREVIISLNTVERISYMESKVFVKLTKVQVQKLGDQHALRLAAEASLAGALPSLTE